jgi:hypothetical protein
MNTKLHQYFLEPRNTQNNTERFQPVEFNGFRISNYGESATINRVELKAFGGALL